MHAELPCCKVRAEIGPSLAALGAGPTCVPMVLGLLKHDNEGEKDADPLDDGKEHVEPNPTQTMQR